jgi:hypothetical protein
MSDVLSPIIPEPQCSKRHCKHLLGVYQPTGEETGGEFVVCPAFPKGIPADIAYGDNPHLTDDPRQIGRLVFEPYPEDDDTQGGAR